MSKSVWDTPKKKKPPSSARLTEVFAICDLFVAQLLRDFLDTGRTDIASLIGDDILCVAAEDTGRLILLENDGVILNKDFEWIPFADLECAAQFNGQDDTAEVIDFADDTGGFQGGFLLFVGVCRRILSVFFLSRPIIPKNVFFVNISPCEKLWNIVKKFRMGFGELTDGTKGSKGVVFRVDVLWPLC